MVRTHIEQFEVGCG